MTYQRKTRDVFEVEQYFGTGHGWEFVCSENTRREANERRREYRDNQPEFAVRVRKHREPIKAN